MTDNDQSFADLFHNLLADTRDLVRERSRWLERRSGGDVEGRCRRDRVRRSGARRQHRRHLLCIALGGAIAFLVNWPPWAGYGLVAIVLRTMAALLGFYGWRRLAAFRASETAATVKENFEWILSEIEGR